MNTGMKHRLKDRRVILELEQGFTWYTGEYAFWNRGGITRGHDKK